MITVTSVAIDQFRQFDNISFCHDDTWHIDCVKLQEFFVFDTLNALMFPCNWIDDDRRYWFDGQTIQLNYAYNTYLINNKYKYMDGICVCGDKVWTLSMNKNQ